MPNFLILRDIFTFQLTIFDDIRIAKKIYLRCKPIRFGLLTWAGMTCHTVLSIDILLVLPYVQSYPLFCHVMTTSYHHCDPPGSPSN